LNLIFENSFNLLPSKFGRIEIKSIFAQNNHLIQRTMYWTLELASYLEDAPWPASKDELIDFAIRAGAPLEVVENLQDLEDEGDIYESIEEIWPDYPSQEDFLFNEDEY
jgi:hypothetical protein